MSAIRTEYSRRAFLLTIYLISLGVIAFYFMMFPWLQPRMSKVLLLLGLGLAFLGGYIYTIKTSKLANAAHFYNICLYASLIINASITGGIGAPGTIWFVLCPMLAFITVSTKTARVWLIVVLSTIAAFFFFEKHLVLRQFQATKVWYFFSYMMFFPVLYLILRVFRTEVSKRNLALITLNQRLEVERRMLRKSQEDLLLKSEQLREAETVALNRSARLSYYLDQLIEVKRMEELHTGSLHYAVQAITEFLIRAMNLDNVAVWQVRPDSQSLELFQYGGKSSNAERPIIHRDDFEDAYDMLATGAIVTGKAHEKEAEELRLLFRKSAGTHSMINCPFFIDGKFSGFISCRATERIWVQEDIIFVRAISDTIPLAFKSHVRRVQQDLLEAKQREITEINNSLEKKVIERTLLLNERNRQLTDFAFTNAHHIRGPLCRMLGLQNLLTINTDPEEIKKIAGYMSVSLDELDNITRKTSAELNKIIED